MGLTTCSRGRAALPSQVTARPPPRSGQQPSPLEKMQVLDLFTKSGERDCYSAVSRFRSSPNSASTALLQTHGRQFLLARAGDTDPGGAEPACCLLCEEGARCLP